MEECVCKNCGLHFVGNFCPRCGQSRKTRRLSFLHMVDDAIGLFANLDSGFLRSVTELYWRPGYMIRDYIMGKRKGYMKPLSLLFCLSTIYYLITYLLAKDEFLVADNLNGEINSLEKVVEISPYVQTIKEYLVDLLNNPAAVQLCLMIPMVPAAWLTFRKTKIGRAFNMMEQFHIQVIIACQVLIYTMILSLSHWFSYGQLEFNNHNLVPNILLVIWDYKQLYDLTIWQSVKKTLISYALDLLILALLFLPVVIVIAALISGR